MRVGTWALALALCLGCSGMHDGGSGNVGSDAGKPDSGQPDAGPPDSGPPDAGPPDAGPPDAGPDAPDLRRARAVAPRQHDVRIRRRHPGRAGGGHLDRREPEPLGCDERCSLPDEAGRKAVPALRREGRAPSADQSRLVLRFQLQRRRQAVPHLRSGGRPGHQRDRWRRARRGLRRLLRPPRLERPTRRRVLRPVAAQRQAGPRPTQRQRNARGDPVRHGVWRERPVLAQPHRLSDGLRPLHQQARAVRRNRAWRGQVQSRQVEAF